MKVLIVCRALNDQISPFVKEQVEDLENLGVKIEWCTVEHGGIAGYFSALGKLRRLVKQLQPDIVHAHYGLSGFMAMFQSKPLVVTFHGTDVNNVFLRLFSRIAALCSRHVIFVSEQLRRKMPVRRASVIPCGVDLIHFHEMDKATCRDALGFPLDKKMVLFGAAFSNDVKNPQLALEVKQLLEVEGIEMLEFAGYAREKVPMVLNAADVILLTSRFEGSPQVIKEALACNRPIVCTDAGDVSERLKGLRSCFLTSFDKNDLVKNIKLALEYKGSEGRGNVLELERKRIAHRIVQLYKSIV